MGKPKVYWCKAISQEKESGHEYWASCDPYNDVYDGGDFPDDNDKRYWESTNDNYWKERFSDDEDNMDPPFKTDESKECEDPKECVEDKANAKFRVVLDKLNDDWFNDTNEDADDLEGIIGYLEPTSYNGFTDLDYEAYKKRKSKLLGMTYRKPPPILIEKTKVTRFSQKETNFEVTLTRIHVEKMLMFGRNHSSYAITEDVMM
nr:hypothetical protein [Tanacetum cinerariifolium]